MIKKTLIVGLILCSFLVASVSTVIAADKTLTDKTGDVINYYTDETVDASQNIDVDNIDIKEVTYSKQDETITLTLKVKGSIQNKGNIDTINYEDIIGNIDAVIYELNLFTSKEYYYVAYVNNEIIVMNETENISGSDFSIIEEGSTLKVTFDALHDDETYEDMAASASYVKMPDLSTDFGEEDYEFLFDYVPDETSLLVIIHGPSDGEVEEDIDFTSTISGGSTPYTYAWDFGDGEASDDENDTTHTYDTAGTYTVILTVTDDYNNQDSDSFTITISDNEANNGGGTEENSAILLFAAVIAIIVIIGVIVIVLIIRR